MDKVYFVSWYLHNKTNGGWAYKVENKYPTKDLAEKAFFTLGGNYIGGDTYDNVTIILNDSDGIIWERKHWPEVSEPLED